MGGEGKGQKCLKILYRVDDLKSMVVLSALHLTAGFY